MPLVFKIILENASLLYLEIIIVMYYDLSSSKINMK